MKSLMKSAVKSAMKLIVKSTMKSVNETLLGGNGNPSGLLFRVLKMTCFLRCNFILVPSVIIEDVWLTLHINNVSHL